MRPKTPKLHLCFLALCGLLITINAFQLFQKLWNDRPISFAGLKFSGLGDQLKGQTSIGYASDMDLQNPGPLAEYQQAQFVLAPVILDINFPSRHHYILINCSNDEAAIGQLKALNARPLLRNQFGVILAETQTRPNPEGS